MGDTKQKTDLRKACGPSNIDDDGGTLNIEAGWLLADDSPNTQSSVEQMPHIPTTCALSANPGPDITGSNWMTWAWTLEL